MEQQRGWGQHILPPIYPAAGQASAGGGGGTTTTTTTVATPIASTARRKSGVSAAPGTSQGAGGTDRKRPYCGRCRNHGVKTIVRGHKAVCPRRDCNCSKCSLNNMRKQLAFEANQLKRTDVSGSLAATDSRDDDVSTPGSVASQTTSAFTASKGVPSKSEMNNIVQNLTRFHHCLASLGNEQKVLPLLACAVLRLNNNNIDEVIPKISEAVQEILQCIDSALSSMVEEELSVSGPED